MISLHSHLCGQLVSCVMLLVRYGGYYCGAGGQPEGRSSLSGNRKTPVTVGQKVHNTSRHMALL